MRAIETGLAGAVVVEPTPASDERGFFARTWCARTFAEWGLDPALTQCSVSFNHRRGTVRGMHYQADPHGEAKLVRCTQGAIYDVIVDVRPGSATHGRWFGIELTPANHKALFIPKGFAHGFQTLADDSEVYYQISVEYVAEAARGIRHDDPAVGIVWPLPVAVISDRDRNLPALGA
ncbi:dTDP-4-dehydrorhamnose 3,5-epimerase [Azospirillum brasilense]|uniref:dTDP-4-dehydrorhamnose 3,5-epimerase n=1 Tax=Azospirillum brasilense TaxID=192 RepID=A0A6L3AS03_AZOBR|nr:dTDP-4-dehydrorhamnose 3,5-epimerase [Azospirillum brasilense]KAA0677116.1 dTDP-4-dehydrorhamnose 3,5-epimerase [Azospirillum brasilense]